MKDKSNIFERAPIPKAVASMALPCVVTSLVIVIYNMADTFFVGQTGNSNQVAAVSLANPVFVMFMALSNLLGIGSNAAISITLGKGDKEKAKNISSFCCYASLILGTVMGIMLIIFMNPLLKILGSDANTYQYAKDYTFYIAIGAPLILFSNAFGHAIRGEGAATESMIGSMIGTVANIVLDPIFILWLGMDTGGAAIATVLGNMCSALYYLWYFLRKSNLLSISPKYFKPFSHVSLDVLSIGLPSCINSALMSVSNILLNNALTSYGNNPVAAMGVATKAYFLIVFIQMGISNGIQPLLGYNFGSGNRKRFMGIAKFSAVCTFVIGSVLTVIYFAFSNQIISAFIDDAEVIKYGISMLEATAITGPVIGWMFILINCMQSMKKTIPAALLSICRQGLVFIPMLFVLKKLFGLNGIMYTQAIADYACIIIAAITMFFIMRNKNLFVPIHSYESVSEPIPAAVASDVSDLSSEQSNHPNLKSESTKPSVKSKKKSKGGKSKSSRAKSRKAKRRNKHK